MNDLEALPAAIGKRVRDNRETKGWSRETCAERADVSISFLSDIEHGRKSMTTTSLYKICKALDISADYLLFGREAVEADNISRAIRLASSADRKHLEELLFSVAKILGLPDDCQIIDTDKENP